jgi:hypothetical protein
LNYQITKVKFLPLLQTIPLTNLLIQIKGQKMYFCKKMREMNAPDNWKDLCKHLTMMFGIEVDMNGVLFLIGIREMGLLFREFSKEEKLNLINLGSCTLYKEMGLVEISGEDNERWPVFRQKTLAPVIAEELKLKTLQDCAIRYFGKVWSD